MVYIMVFVQPPSSRKDNSEGRSQRDQLYLGRSQSSQRSIVNWPRKLDRRRSRCLNADPRVATGGFGAVPRPYRELVQARSWCRRADAIPHDLGQLR